MPTGMIHKLVHLSQQTYQPHSKLISGHNDKGYGTIDDGKGHEVYRMTRFLESAVSMTCAEVKPLSTGSTMAPTCERQPFARHTCLW
jgi:hypothetical protein